MEDTGARSGTIYLKVDGEPKDLVGEFKFGLGKPIREGQSGPNGVHGYKETTSIPFIEGEIRDGKDVSLEDIAKIKNATITLELANGKTYVWKNAWSCNPDGLGMGTEEGNIAVRFEAKSAQEVR